MADGATPRAAGGATPRAAVTVVFLVQGLLFASWTAHIPHVQQHLGLGDGALGTALLGAPVGSVLAMLAAAALLPRFGSRRLVRVALVGYCAAGPAVGLTGSLATLFVALLVWGAFQGTLDVAMNTQAIAVERRARRPLMPGFHGSWSIGALAGAALGTLGVAAGVSLSVQLLLLATPCVFAAGWLTTGMVPDTPPSPVDAASPAAPGTAPAPGATRAPGTAPAPGTTRAPGTAPGNPSTPPAATPGAATRGARSPRHGPYPAILALGAIALADMLCEGAAADWSAVYLRTTLHTGAAVAGLAYAAYSLAMVAVRLSGNRLLDRFPARRLLPVLAGVATVGFTAGLVVDRPAIVLVGFACLGAGLAAVIPTVFGAAGRVPGIAGGTAVALVSACGWVGFVCGPPLVGQLADATTLRAALVIVPAMTASIMVATAASRALGPAVTRR